MSWTVTLPAHFPFARARPPWNFHLRSAMKSDPTVPVTTTVDPKNLRRQIVAARSDASRTAEFAAEAKSDMKKAKKAFRRAKKAAKQARKALKALVALQTPAAPRKPKARRSAKVRLLVLRKSRPFPAVIAAAPPAVAPAAIASEETARIAQTLTAENNPL